MAKQTINIGTSANDRSGDPLRTAFDKINQNFTELYNAVADDVQIPSVANNAGKILSTDGSTVSWTTIQSGASLGNFKISGEYMGTVDNPDTGGWGGYDMVFTPNDNRAWITIPNDTNSDAGNALRLGNYGDGGIEVISSRGNVTLGGNIEVPGVPQHFHIAFSQSNLYAPNNDLFLGDDFNAVQLHGTDGAPYYGVNIRATDRQTQGATTHQWRFGTNGQIVFPDNTTQATAWTSGTFQPGVGTQVTGVRAPDGAGANNGYVWVPYAPPELEVLGDITGYTISWDQGQWTTTVVQMRNDLGAPWAIETADSFIHFNVGDTYTYTSPGYVAPVPNPVNVNVGNNLWTFDANGNLTLPATGQIIGNDVAVRGIASVTLKVTSATNPLATKDWGFDGIGRISFPDGTTQSTAYNGLLKTVTPTPGTLSVGAATAITVTNSPNPNWTTGTGVFANGINFAVAVDGLGNATVSVINDGGTGHFVGEAFGPVLGSAFGGTDIVDDMYFSVAAVDADNYTALSLTKQVQKLTDGYYTLADGVEGQVMYLVRQNGSSTAIFMRVANGRFNGTTYANVAFMPFNGGSQMDMVTMLFTDGSWQSNNGIWD